MLRIQVVGGIKSHLMQYFSIFHVLPPSDPQKSDVRLMRSEASLKSLLGMQSMILDATWETLKINGRFLVTTCSILPQENEHQIRKFLDRHSDAVLVQIEGVPGIHTQFGIQHFPFHTGGDGFFYSLLVKSAPSIGKVSA